jgi:hypothetical protein
MIYRILVDTTDVIENADGTFALTKCLRGAMAELCDVMADLHLPSPSRLQNSRTRFYFTERGWRRIGRRIAAEARRRGHTVKVIRRKNPRPSQIVYEDKLQLALLPNRGRPPSDA